MGRGRWGCAAECAFATVRAFATEWAFTAVREPTTERALTEAVAASAPGRPWQKSCQLDEEMLKRERIREQEIAMLKQQVASLASSMETMVRLTERAYGTETGQASPSTQVRHVAPQPFQLSRTRQIAKPQSMYHQTSAQLENTPGISSAQRAAWQSPINARRLPPNPASTLRFLPPVR